MRVHSGKNLFVFGRWRCLWFLVIIGSCFLCQICNGEENAVTIRESAYFVYNHGNENIHDMIRDIDQHTNSDASSDVARKCHPRQIHLSLGNAKGSQDESRTSMTVSFSIPFQYDMSCHPENMKIVLDYGISSEAVKKENRQKIVHQDDADVTVRRYHTVSPLTGESYESDFIYHVTLYDLEASSDYSYSISVFEAHLLTSKEKRGLRMNGIADPANDESSGDIRLQNGMYGTKIAQTQPLKFRTAPTTSSRDPVKFAIVGDLGQAYNSTMTMLHILASTHPTLSITGTDREEITPVTALLIAGDMSYANSIQPQWDNWFNLIQPIAQKIPMMVAVGNHEIECDYITHVPFMAYENRFFIPNRLGDAIIEPVGSRYWNDSKWGCATPR